MDGQDHGQMSSDAYQLAQDASRRGATRQARFFGGLARVHMFFAVVALVVPVVVFVAVVVFVVAVLS